MGMKDQFQEKSEQMRDKAQERMGQGQQGREHQRQGGGQGQGQGQRQGQRPGGSPQERGRREVDDISREERERFDPDYDM